MDKYAAFVGDDFVFHVHASSREEALDEARKGNSAVTRVELVSLDRDAA